MPISTATNVTALTDDSEITMTADDAVWIITNSFIIFTMQTGFGLLESGSVAKKNEVNIMVKNLVDIALGGLTYWMFGYGLSFGDGPLTTPFFGVGHFFLDTYNKDMGTIFTTFLFQLSFATTATTIVSGAMAERCNFTAYCVFSFVNTVVYCIPAGWIWGKHGFLYKLGVIDVAGSCGVHLVGGVSAFVSAAMLGPRHGRYDHGTEPLPLGSPTNALLGLFVLWWGWLSFNCGSMFGVTNHKWKYAARISVVTIVSSFGGGMVGMFYSYITRNKKFDVSVLINSILSSLVAVTAGCALYHPWESLVIGAISSLATCLFTPLMDTMHIDDPVGAVAVHAIGGFLGMLSVGLFAENDPRIHYSNGNSGLFRGGGFYLLGIQTLACACIILWSASTTFIILFVINRIIPIRMTLEAELLGADLLEHNVRHDIIFDQNVISSENIIKIATLLSEDRENNIRNQLEIKHCKSRNVIDIAPNDDGSSTRPNNGISSAPPATNTTNRPIEMTPPNERENSLQVESINSNNSQQIINRPKSNISHIVLNQHIL